MCACVTESVRVCVHMQRFTWEKGKITGKRQHLQLTPNATAERGDCTPLYCGIVELTRKKKQPKSLNQRVERSPKPACSLGWGNCTLTPLVTIGEYLSV